jgi:magnesium-transporting ATPase (P-type)
MTLMHGELRSGFTFLPFKPKTIGLADGVGVFCFLFLFFFKKKYENATRPEKKKKKNFTFGPRLVSSFLLIFFLLLLYKEADGYFIL